MPQRQTAHPFLDLIPGALAPHMGHGPGHGEDPPELPAGAASARDSQALAVAAMLSAADRDCRDDRYAAAAAQLGIAETQIALARQHGMPATAGMEAALASIRQAQQEIAQHNSRRACAALAAAWQAWVGSRPQ
jgi:hypothetical protein